MSLNKNKNFMQKLKELLASMSQGAIGILVLFTVWYLACRFTKVGMFLADPITVLKLIGSWCVKPLGRMTLPGHILVSMRRVFTAYILLSIFGIALGIVIGYSKIGRAIFNPLFEMIHPVPGVAWIPITIMLLGVGEKAKIFLICIGCFSGITMQVSRGIRWVDRQLIGAAKVLGASDWQVLTKVILPSVVPDIFLGLNGAMASSWSCVLAAEMICAFEGVGWIITAGSSRGNSAQILGGMIPIGVMGVILTNIIVKIGDRLCAWSKNNG